MDITHSVKFPDVLVSQQQYLAQGPPCPSAGLPGGRQAPDHWTLWLDKEWSSLWRKCCSAHTGLLSDWEWRCARPTTPRGTNVCRPPQDRSHRGGWNLSSANSLQFSDRAEPVAPLHQHWPEEKMILQMKALWSFKVSRTKPSKFSITPVKSWSLHMVLIFAINHVPAQEPVPKLHDWQL